MTQQFHTWVFTWEKEKICPHEDLDTNVYSSFIHNSPKLETTQMSISKRDFPGGAVVKSPPANAGDMGSIPGPGRSHMPQSN